MFWKRTCKIQAIEDSSEGLDTRTLLTVSWCFPTHTPWWKDTMHFLYPLLFSLSDKTANQSSFVKESFVLAYSVWVQTIEAMKAWWWELETSGHVASVVLNRSGCLGSYHCVRSHGIKPPAFQMALSSSVKYFWKYTCRYTCKYVFPWWFKIPLPISCQ